MIWLVDTKLTIEEIEPNHSAIRETPIVNWFTLSNDAVPKGCQITDGRARADELQELANGPLLAPLSKLKKQVRTLVRVGIELVFVLFVEPSSDGVVDRSNDGIVEEHILLSL